MGKVGEWWSGKVGGSWFYSRVGGHRVNPRFHLFFLMMISNGTKEQDRLKIICRGADCFS